MKLTCNSQLLWAGCLISSLIYGCGGGSEGPPRTSVHGTITLNGEPLKTGEIAFRPADGKGPTDATQIHNGKFQLDGVSGEKIVQITSYQESSKKAPDGLPVSENIVPKEYNSASQLKAKIPSKEALKFELTSQPASKAAEKK